jgi:predicted dehydrogenase
VFLTGSLVKSVFMSGLRSNPAENTDNAVLILKFQNGSQATVNYFANGSKAYSKERFEVFSSERTWVMDNFRTTKGYGVKGFKDLSTKMDKGHKAQFHGLIQRIQQGGEALIPVNELFNTAKASLAAIESLKKGAWIQID